MRARHAPNSIRPSVAGVLGLLLAHVVAASPGWADSDGEAEPAWIPAIEFRFDSFDYDTTSSVQNSLNPPAQEGSDSDSARKLVYLVGGEIEGPILEALPGRPRLFARGGAQLGGLSNDDILRVGDLRGDPELEITQFQAILAADLARGCMNFDPPTCNSAEAGDFAGQGSEIEAKLDAPGWYGGLGIAWSFPVARSLLFQVKPSVAYNFDRIRFTGQITTVTEEGEIAPNIPNFVVHRGAAKAYTNQHRLGPGLELGLVLFRSLRPIRVSIWGEARFLWLLGDRNTTLSDSIGTYEIRTDRFGIRAGAGVRLSWMGLRGR